MSLTIKKINLIKISLDVVMAVILFLMYNSKVVSLNFHEIGGLFVCGLFLIHKLINWKWIAAVSKKLFTKDLNIKLRLGYIVDFLLLISMTAILVSGIFISKIVFRNLSMNVSGIWRTLHYCVSAVSLILVGIHLGLHWNFVTGIFKKYVKIPSMIAKPVSILLVIAVVAYGSYNIVTTSFTQWLTMPFTAGQMGSFEGKQSPRDFNPGDFNPGDFNPDQSGDSTNGVVPDQNAPSDNSSSGSSSVTGKSMSTNPTTDNNSGNDNIQDPQQNQSQDQSQSQGRPGKGTRPEGGNFKGGGFRGSDFEGGRPGAGGSSALNILLTYGSIVGFFAAVTYYIEKLLKARSRKTKAELLPENT